MKKSIATLLGLCLLGTLPGCCWSCNKDEDGVKEEKMSRREKREMRETQDTTVGKKKMRDM